MAMLSGMQLAVRLQTVAVKAKVALWFCNFFR